MDFMYRSFVLTFVCLLPALADDAPQLVFDRGLPAANLNNAGGDSNRSNVRWSLYAQGFVGDDFSIGQPGEKWVIDSIRTWTVPGVAGKDPIALGSYYQDVRLYFGTEEGGLSPVRAGRLAADSNTTDNDGISIREADVARYDEFGAMMRVYEIEFKDLKTAVEGGKKYRFGAWGLGRDIPGQEGKAYSWFTYASNALRSETRQDGADGRMLLFEPSGSFAGDWDSNSKSWNKSSDVNVQVFAHKTSRD
jgi:hypothetical protein